MQISDPVLRINNLSKSYGSVIALLNLSIEVGRGQVFGILGPNGSGKTTTLSILTGILQQDEEVSHGSEKNLLHPFAGE